MQTTDTRATRQPHRPRPLLDLNLIRLLQSLIVDQWHRHVKISRSSVANTTAAAHISAL